MRRLEDETDAGIFLLGALVGAGLALLFASESVARRRHDLALKFRKLLHLRHNGAAVNGQSTPVRRHKRA